MRIPHLRNEIDAVVANPPGDACAIFSGKRQPNGYGRVSIDSVYRRAHVYACEQAHGPCPPDKSEVAHSCGERMCINPRHLRWATRQENAADHVLHGTTNRGEQSGTARLTWKQVSAIRSRYIDGNVTQQQLANEHGVHVMTINDIIHHRTWQEPF